MTIEISINELGLERMVEEVFNRVKIPVQAAMAGEFREITLANFGASGVARPRDWAELSKRYSKRVHRDYATLHLNGDLFDSIEIDPFSEDGAAVFTNNPYASTHQFGDASRNIPARPFMPIQLDRELTPYARNRVLEAAGDALSRELS